MKKPLLTIFAFTVIGFGSCKKDHTINVVKEYPAMAEAANPAILMTTADGVKAYNGGFGSAVAPDPKDPNVFYLLTDRGPNAAGAVTNAIIFGKADFTP